MKITKYLLVGLFLFQFNLAYAALPADFVYLKDIDSTIINSLRYPTKINLTGHVVNGYKSGANVIITKQAAEALKCAQAKFNKDNYSIVVYDAYRPQDGVDDFKQWAKDKDEAKMKSWFYPNFDKAKAFDLGYIALKSGHTRGSTIDMTIIEKDKHITPIKPMKRKLTNKVTKKEEMITYLDDGTVDMGSSFDLIDEASHSISDWIDKRYLEKRGYFIYRGSLKICQNSHAKN